jgi:hypothetical protein
VDFTIRAVAMHPYVGRAYELAPNVRRVITVPIWGTEDPAEYGRYESAGDFLRCRWATTDEVIAQRFVPGYTRFLSEAITATPALAAMRPRLAARYFGH